MARRRPSFSTYAARRWRVVGLLAVLLAGSLLVLATIDRGHEPGWTARTGAVDSAAVSPDGATVYALLREGDLITRLEARRGESGALLWESPMDASRALLAADGQGVAVATDFPFAFLTVYAVNGSVRFQVPLEGNPRAMAMEEGRVAIALMAPGNPVLLFENGRLARSHGFTSFVKALDLRDGRLAVGAGDGELVLFERNGTLLHNSSLPMSVRSLRLNEDASVLLVGGAALLPGDLSGSYALIDVTLKPPLRWTRHAAVSVGLVGLDDAGVWAMVVEESPPNYRIRVLEAATGAERWTREMDGYVARDDPGRLGGAAISPDGRHVVAGTLRGDLLSLRVHDGRERWRFDGEGVNQVEFPRDAPGRALAAGRLVPAGPHATLLLFSMDTEPFAGRLPLLALVLTLAAFLIAALVLGVGYHRARRSF